ncbi:MAG: hypothetical protein GEU82_11760 [Luteitalea sp.]|nr:hypothetical protein [Luteitalea sp.]
MGRAAAMCCLEQLANPPLNYDGLIGGFMLSAQPMLHEFVTANREEIVARCRMKVSARSDPPPTSTEIDHGVPMFLDEMVSSLRLGLSGNLQIADTAAKHGHDLLRQGFTVSQVVHDYGDVCQTITEMAGEKSTTISTEDFRKLNSCLDDAIAGAVTEHGRGHLAWSERVEGDNLSIDALADRLRNEIQTAIITLGVLEQGRVGISGSTGTVLKRSLLNSQGLIDRLQAVVKGASR